MNDAPRLAIPANVFFEDVEIGARYRTPGRVITAADIHAFCALTGDWHKLHTDADYARSQGFAGIIAHGLFCLSVMEGLKTVSGLYETTSVASLGWDSVRFRVPVVEGDEVHVEFSFDAKRSSAKGGRGVVSESVLLINQRREVVVSATHAALIIMRDRTSTGENDA